MENEQEMAAQDYEVTEQESATEAQEVQAEQVPARPANPPVAAAESADFEELTAAMLNSESAPLSTLYDLNLPISIELGRTSMKVQEVLQLGRGSVIELDRLAGEPVDIYVGDRRFAEGEVVVLGENFGVRITRIVPSAPLEAA